MDSLKTKAYQHIRSGLLAGRWPEGTFLSPAKVAKQIGISYTPVREAVLQLASEGLVEHIPKLGICAKRLDRSELEDLLNMRTILESGAAKLAARLITQEDLSLLSDLCRQHLAILKDIREAVRNNPNALMQGHVLQLSFISRIAEINTQFHTTVIRASQNGRLMKAAGDLHILTSSCLYQGQYHPTDENPFWRLARDYGFHRRILHALTRHDEQAAYDITEKHLEDARIYHLKTFDQKSRLGRIKSVETELWPKDILEKLANIEQQGLHNTSE